MEVKKDYEKNTFLLENVTVYVCDNKIAICGMPLDIENLLEEKSHNCDYMGCSSVEHVIIRADIKLIDSELKHKINELLIEENMK
jgi:hypothetical protein